MIAAVPIYASRGSTSNATGKVPGDGASAPLLENGRRQSRRASIALWEFSEAIAPIPKITARNSRPATTKKIPNRTLETDAAPRATPPKPSAPATTATTSAIIAYHSRSIEPLLSIF
jgi:hypothetical protein